jgi:tripartite motif-containing protein 71
MRKLVIATALCALTAVCTWGEWVYEGEWGRLGSGNGEFDFPTDVGVAPNGNVYVCDNGNFRIQYFNADGSFVGKRGSCGTGNGQFGRPWGLTFTPNGNVYVVDDLNHRLQYFAAAGSFAGLVGLYGSGEGEFINPLDLGFSGDGNRLYVADTDNNRVQYFRWSTPQWRPRR